MEKKIKELEAKVKALEAALKAVEATAATAAEAAAAFEALFSTVNLICEVCRNSYAANLHTGLPTHCEKCGRPTPFHFPLVIGKEKNTTTVRFELKSIETKVL